MANILDYIPVISDYRRGRYGEPSLNEQEEKLKLQKLQEESAPVPQITPEIAEKVKAFRENFMQRQGQGEQFAERWKGLQEARRGSEGVDISTASQIPTFKEASQQAISEEIPAMKEPEIPTIPYWKSKELEDQKLKESLYGYRTAQTGKLNIMNRSIGEMFPSITDEQIKNQFGEGIDKNTPFIAVNQIGKYKIQQERNQRMFPIASLSPEAQLAARNSGLPDFVPESTARILNQGNPPRIPSAEETTGLATAQSISDKINKVATAFPIVGDRALGFGNYQINKYGQYIPFMESDPAIVDFYTNINSINNALIYYMSGKQINEQEAKRIKSEMLEPELNKDAFQARLKTVIDNWNYLRNLRDRAISGVGKRTPELSGVPKSTETGNPKDLRKMWNDKKSDPLGIR